MNSENRIAKAAAKIADRIVGLDSEARINLDRNMAIDFQEHFQFQQTQSKAFAMGKISLDEAQTIYQSLGEVGSKKNGGWADGTSTAYKVAITLTIAELI